MDKKIISISLANPRGFCAGVDRAIEIVEQSLDKYGAPIYVRNEVVHNKFVIESLKKKGAIFVNDLKVVPENSYLIYSCLLYTSPSPRDKRQSRMPSSA